MSGQPPGGPFPPPPPGEQPWGPPPSPGGWPAPPGAPGAPGAPPGAGGPPPQGPWQQQPPGQWGWQPQPYGGPATRTMRKAGFWARFAALFLDGLILLVLYIPGAVAIAAGPTEEEPCTVDTSGDIVIDDGPNNAFCEVPTGGTIAVSVLLFVGAFAAQLVYIAVLEGKRGQTWGKQALGIRVLDQYTAQPIGPGRAIGRYFARIPSGLVCYLGYLWMLWDEDRQTWHDKIVGSVVVQT